MRVIFVLMLFAMAQYVPVPFTHSGSHGTFTLSASRDNGSCAELDDCAISGAPTSGHSLIVAAVMPSSENLTTSTTGCTVTWSNVQSTGDSTAGYITIAECTNASGSAVTCYLSGVPSGAWGCYEWELSDTQTISYDTGGTELDSSNCTSCAGVALTLTGPNDAIATACSAGGTASAISPYTSSFSFDNGDAYGYVLNTTSGSAPTITQSPTSHMACAAIALED